MKNRSCKDGADHSQLAVIGSLGIPARYGGYETVAERTSRELSDRGYRIVVSCELDGRSDHTDSGVRLAFVPLRPPGPYFLRKPYEVINDILSMVRLSSTTDAIYLLGC